MNYSETKLKQLLKCQEQAEMGCVSLKQVWLSMKYHPWQPITQPGTVSKEQPITLKK